MKSIDQQVEQILRRKRALEKSIREGRKLRFTSEEEPFIRKIRLMVEKDQHLQNQQIHEYSQASIVTDSL